jgi:hypothetical protein
LANAPFSHVFDPVVVAVGREFVADHVVYVFGDGSACDEDAGNLVKFDRTTMKWMKRMMYVVSQDARLDSDDAVGNVVVAVDAAAVVAFVAVAAFVDDVVAVAAVAAAGDDVCGGLNVVDASFV